MAVMAESSVTVAGIVAALAGKQNVTPSRLDSLVVGPQTTNLHNALLLACILGNGRV